MCRGEEGGGILLLSFLMTNWNYAAIISILDICGFGIFIVTTKT